MPLVISEPYGNIVRAEYSLAITLANCTAFQSLVGAANETEALNSIYFHELPDPQNGQDYTAAELQEYRPFALIYTAYPSAYRIHGDGEVSHGDAGSIVIQIETDVEESHKADGTAMIRFENIIEKIMQYRTNAADTNRGLADLFRIDGGTAPGYLAASRMTLLDVNRGAIQERPEYGDYTRAAILVEWGGNNA